jgi:hypothetical protein
MKNKTSILLVTAWAAIWAAGSFAGDTKSSSTPAPVRAAAPVTAGRAAYPAPRPGYGPGYNPQQRLPGRPTYLPQQRYMARMPPPRNSLAARLASCAAPGAPGCGGVWRRMQSPRDRTYLDRARFMASTNGSSYTTWVGSDGVTRQAWVTVEPPVMMSNIVLLPSAGYAYSGYADPAAGGPAPGGGPPVGVGQPGTMPYQAPGNGAGPGTSSGTASTTYGATPPDPIYKDYRPPTNDSTPSGSAEVIPQALCRKRQTVVQAGTDHDQATDLECRDANGDWIEATQAGQAN